MLHHDVIFSYYRWLYYQFYLSVIDASLMIIQLLSFITHMQDDHVNHFTVPLWQNKPYMEAIEEELVNSETH